MWYLFNAPCDSSQWFPLRTLVPVARQVRQMPAPHKASISIPLLFLRHSIPESGEESIRRSSSRATGIAAPRNEYGRVFPAHNIPCHPAPRQWQVVTRPPLFENTGFSPVLHQQEAARSMYSLPPLPGKQGLAEIGQTAGRCRPAIDRSA